MQRKSDMVIKDWYICTLHMGIWKYIPQTNQLCIPCWYYWIFHAFSTLNQMDVKKLIGQAKHVTSRSCAPQSIQNGSDMARFNEKTGQCFDTVISDGRPLHKNDINTSPESRHHDRCRSCILQSYFPACPDVVLYNQRFTVNGFVPYTSLVRALILSRLDYCFKVCCMDRQHSSSVNWTASCVQQLGWYWSGSAHSWECWSHQHSHEESTPLARRHGQNQIQDMRVRVSLPAEYCSALPVGLLHSSRNVVWSISSATQDKEPSARSELAVIQPNFFIY